MKARKFLSALLTSVMVLSTMCFSTYANETSKSIIGYTSTDRIWGECGGAASESFELKNVKYVASIGETKYATLQEALSTAGAAGAGNTTIEIVSDIDLKDVDWTPITVDGYHGADIVTINGNNHTITNISAPLFAGGFAGGSGIVINDLTIADSEIVSANTLGSGAFIESVDSMDTITLSNCHLLNSTVTGGDGSRTGGLIGWTAGYNNVNDGPVKTYVTVTNCSVIGCTITSNGSVGAINGHAGNNAWTYTTIENCTIKDNQLISTDDGGWRVGIVVGTANVGEITIDDITESGNTLTQTSKTMPEGQTSLVGRAVFGDTGTLTIDGIPYNSDLKPYVTWNTDSDAGFYYIGETKYGMMRFLFKADITDTVTEVGIKYINGSNISENVTGESAVGATPVTATGDIKAFYGDIVNIPDTVNEGTYYAAAYVKTENQTLWSDIVDCSINWTQHFTNYPAGGTDNE